MQSSVVYLDGAAGVVSEDWVSEDEDQAVAHTGEQHRVIHAARDQARPHGQQTEQPPQSNQAAKAKQSNLSKNVTLPPFKALTRNR